MIIILPYYYSSSSGSWIAFLPIVVAKLVVKNDRCAVTSVNLVSAAADAHHHAGPHPVPASISEIVPVLL